MSIKALVRFGAVAGLAAGFALSLATAASADDCNRAGGRASAPTVVHFDTGKTAIKPEYQKELNDLAERLRGNPNIKICVAGQADKQGNEDYNEKLALKRAETVAAHLQNQGLPKNQFQVYGRGEAFGDGLFSDAAEADRRVEVLVIRY